MFIHVGKHRYQIMILLNAMHDFNPVTHRGFIDEGRRIIYISARESATARPDLLRHEAIHAWEFGIGPPADSIEHRANWMATVSGTIEMQIEQQGGWPALMALPADDTPASEPVETIDEPEERPVTARAHSHRPPGLTPSDLAVLSQWKRRAEAAKRPLPPTSGGRSHTPAAPSYGEIAAPPTTLFLGNRYCECGQGAIPSMIFNEPVESSEVFGLKVRRTLHCSWCQHLVSWIEAAELDGKPGGVAIQLEPTITKGKAMTDWLARHPQYRAMEL